MNTFEKKVKGDEAKFAKEQELKFRSISRRNKLIAIWASSLMKKNEEDTKTYFMDIISLYIDKPDDKIIIEKITNDLKENNIEISIEEINNKLSECLKEAQSQLMNE